MHGRQPLVPRDFQVPRRLETDRFHLRMLTVNDLIKDYEAVMSSVEHLKATFSAIAGGTWPEGLTLEEDLIDLGWHQREFTLNYSFAYTMMTLDESRCLGCVYIDPTLKRGCDAQVAMWVREDELGTGLDERLYGVVKSWVAECWPFRHAIYPGRELSIDEYRAMPSTAH